MVEGYDNINLVCKFLNLSFNEVMAMPIHEFNQIIKEIKRKKDE
jgi:hypothetical protein